MAQLESIIVPALNHLLEAEPWSAARLRAYADAQVRIEAGPVCFCLAINARGYFAPGDSTLVPSVTITLPDDFPAKLLVDRDKLFSSVKLSGMADLAEALAFVFRNLRWDIEGDLARMVGDIVARRSVQAGRHLLQQGMVSGQRLIENVAEYCREDAGMLVSSLDIRHFSGEVSCLRDDLARLEKRFSAL